jgi:hypothetical protein
MDVTPQKNAEEQYEQELAARRSAMEKISR